MAAQLDEQIHLGKSWNSSSMSSSTGVSWKFHSAAMTESESSFQEAISRAAAVLVSQGLLCLNLFTNHRENWIADSAVIFATIVTVNRRNRGSPTSSANI
jgi:hypothetical protein